MKTNSFKIVSSFLAISIFILLASAYEYTQRTEYLGNGVYKQTSHEILDKFNIIKTGTRDGNGNWHGVITIKSERSVQGEVPDPPYIETVNYVHGSKHGKSVFITPTETKNYCYNMGKIVPCDGQNLKEESGSRSNPSSFKILEEKYPWYVLSYLSFSTTYKDSFERWMIAIENKLNTYPLNDQNFQQYFDEVWTSEEITNGFENINNDYQILRFFSQLDLLKENEFRRALVERYTQTKMPTIDILNDRYRYYLDRIELFCTALNVPVTEVKVFFEDFDKMMDKKIILPVSDPMFLDSLDRSLYQVFNEIAEENLRSDDWEDLLIRSIKSNYQNYDLFKTTQSEILTNNNISYFLESNLSDSVRVPEIIQTLILLQLFEADVVKLAIKEACLTEQKVPLPPEIVTNILGQNTEGIRVRGLITFDGNDAITKSGIVWDTVYNPVLTPNNYINPDNKHDFNVFIDGLIPGKRYFVRSYAVNKAGISYGNTMEFIAGEVSSNKDIQYQSVGWKVYPNPADDQINITFEESLSSFEVFIYSLSGYQVFHNRYNNQP
ncbi:MAG: hypothetical protein IPJ51_04195 [Saprospiraceae bacterium]|nr:hypothetical protein [Saprospiraceae bacterium]